MPVHVPVRNQVSRGDDAARLLPSCWSADIQLLQGLNHDECLLYTCVVWITIALAPKRSVVRWATKGIFLQTPACGVPNALHELC